MTTEADDPLLTRVRAGLDWPSWRSWSDGPLPATPAPTTTARVDPDGRRAEVDKRLALARTVADGGPWLDLFPKEIDETLSTQRDQPLGPLADFTFAIKDLIAVAGHAFSAGSPVRVDAAPETATAPIVEWLQAQGATALGTVTMHEFAFGVTGLNDGLGTAPNPNAPGCCPGGSSSGSASAVADGSARIAIGTDTGGSVRIPAAFCGVAGFKPAFDTYPSQGVFPLSPTLDHVGFLATEVGDIIAVHSALTGESISAKAPARIAVVAADLDPADAVVQAAVTTAVDRIVDELGAEVVEVAWPDPEETFVASSGIMFADAASVHRELLSTHEDRYGADILARLEAGAKLTGTEVAAAHRLRRELTMKVLATLATVDLVITPTVRIEPPTLEEAADSSVPAKIVANTRLGNVVGLPAMSIPAPTDGLPVGLQLTGATNAGVLAAAAAIEPVLV